MTYTLYYISQDVADDGSMGPDDTWSVYSEQYASIDAHEPIEGSSVLVSGNLISEARACEVADARQRASYALARRDKEQSDGTN
jgi:hypothetical protein